MNIKIAAILPLLFLAACVQAPPLNFSVPNVGPTSIKIDAELKSITVSVARPDEATGDLDPNTNLFTTMWKESLQEALDKMAIFRDDAHRKISLSVKILQMDMPGAGLTMTTLSAARYELIDRSNGSIIYTQDISASGVVPGDYALVGFVRAKESINRSVQNNISQFLQALETVDISKPMFPASAQVK